MDIFCQETEPFHSGFWRLNYWALKQVLSSSSPCKTPKAGLNTASLHTYNSLPFSLGCVSL